MHPQARAAAREARRDRAGRPGRLGPGGGARVRDAADAGPRRCASPARTARAGPSASATWCWSTPRPASAMRRSSTWRARSRRSRSTTARCPRPARSGFEYGYGVQAPGGARDVGGAVRRLRERGAGRHRPVHRVGPRQVGRDVTAHAAAAARLRGRRPRALERARGAVPDACRRGQHPLRERLHPGPVLPPAAAPGAGGEDPPADRLHAQEPAAQPALVLAAARARRRDAAARDRRPHRAEGRRDKVTRLLLCTRAHLLRHHGPRAVRGQRAASRSRASRCCTRSRTRRSWS